MREAEGEGKYPLSEFERFFDVLAVRDESQIGREFGRGLKYLKFSPIIEKAFQNYYLHKFIWQIRFAVFAGILLYAIFGILDALILPEVKETLWFIRYGVVCPLGFLFLVATFSLNSESLIQMLHAGLVVVGGMGIVGMIYVAPSDRAHLYYAGLMLVVFYAYTFSALRFYYASLSALSVTLLYPLVDVYVVKTDTEQLIANMFFLGSSNVIGLPVSYLLERHIRRDFLLTMLLAFEKRKTERLNMRLKDISYLDGLTGVPNRRKLEEHLSREWDRAKKSGQPLSLLMVDIDFFKRYNDLLGHLEGDECLRKVAQEINRHVRSGMDLVARYGGEEFAVVLPETNEEQARSIAERIRNDVESLKIPHPASEVSRYITVSVGVATLVPEDNLRKEVLVSMADRALYRAKRRGRNRVETFTPTE